MEVPLVVSLFFHPLYVAILKKKTQKNTDRNIVKIEDLEGIEKLNPHKAPTLNPNGQLRSCIVHISYEIHADGWANKATGSSISKNSYWMIKIVAIFYKELPDDSAKAPKFQSPDLIS